MPSFLLLVSAVWWILSLPHPTPMYSLSETNPPPASVATDKWGSQSSRYSAKAFHSPKSTKTNHRPWDYPACRHQWPQVALVSPSTLYPIFWPLLSPPHLLVSFLKFSHQQNHLNFHLSSLHVPFTLLFYQKLVSPLRTLLPLQSFQKMAASCPNLTYHWPGGKAAVPCVYCQFFVFTASSRPSFLSPSQEHSLF